MKNPIAKLYEKLTPSELATVALKHLYHGDNDEAGRVAAQAHGGNRKTDQVPDRVLDTLY